VMTASLYVATTTSSKSVSHEKKPQISPYCELALKCAAIPVVRSEAFNSFKVNL
jgi:hypothetical protein